MSLFKAALGDASMKDDVLKDKALDLDQFKEFMKNPTISLNVFKTLNLLTDYPKTSDNKLSKEEITAIFESATFLGRVFKLCVKDEGKGLTKEEFKLFVSHEVIGTYFFIIVDGLKGGIGNGEIINEEYKKLGITKDMAKGPMNTIQFRSFLKESENSDAIFNKIKGNDEFVLKKELQDFIVTLKKG